jgi:hypothetical protein
MDTTRLSTKGQILLLLANRFPPTTVDQVFGCLKTDGKKPVTLAKMDEAITKMIKERRAIGRY